MQYNFRPNARVVANTKKTASIPEMEAERGVYSASPEFVRRHCGPIAVSILDCVPAWYTSVATELGLHTNIDVRIHRLYPGDFPAYPGWHCDGEFRETYFSQPDLDRVKVHQHLICTVSTDPEGVSNCEFLAEPFDFSSEEVSADHPLWRQVNRAVEESEKSLVKFTAADGELCLFDNWTLHRATPARKRGWRLFFRMSMWHKPNLGGDGMLTKQEQVYQLVGDQGW